MRYPKYITLELPKSCSYRDIYWIYYYKTNEVTKSKFETLITQPLIKTSYSYLYNYFRFFFIKKERIYTKLKYSRVPQFDIVSGGAAALFAGLIGFLVGEKFGFELPDSGDFFFLFFYITLLGFILRVFLLIFSDNTILFSFYSYQLGYYYYYGLFIYVKHLIMS